MHSLKYCATSVLLNISAAQNVIKKKRFNKISLTDIDL